MSGGVDRAKRESVFLTAQLTCGAEDFGTVRVKNISQTGMLIRCTAGLVKGRKVALNLRGVGNVQGTVVRVGATMVGITFETAIEPALVRRSVGDGPDPLPEYLRVPPALARRRK